MNDKPDIDFNSVLADEASVNDEEYVADMIAEMEAIGHMIREADKQGLLVEVVKTAMESSNSYNLTERCYTALYEWDI